MKSTISGYVDPILSKISTKGAKRPFELLPSPSALELGAQIFTPFDEMMSRTDVAGAVKRDLAPIPSTADREGYHGERHFDWWVSGFRDMRCVSHAAEAFGIRLNQASRVFELGCASGRVLRHFDAQLSGLETWGADLNARHVEWVSQFLPASIRIFQCTSLPHLPLEDNYFDVVCAFSVFTHIDDLELAWLAELRRILKPGGVAYITVHTDETWRNMSPDWPIAHALHDGNGAVSDFGPAGALLGSPLPAERVVFWWEHSSVYNCDVFHANDYILKTWGRILKVEQIVSRGHNYQDVVIMTKR